MLVYRSTVAGAAFASALLVGCSEPDLPTDLRTDGPPNVTTVTVLSDLRTTSDPDFVPGSLDIARLIETATHCRLNDEKRPGLVGLPTEGTTQVCPDDLREPSNEEGVAEGAPPTWFVRVVFDKLLDPDVEDLVPDPSDPSSTLGTLANTQPVTLKCNGTDITYDGYYVPNGNRVSWPLGPALYIQPVSAVSVPTEAMCEVGIKDIVHNKKGESVPADQRSFQFKIAKMKLRFAVVGGTEIDDPADAADGSIMHNPSSPVRFFWTAAFTTPDPNQVQVFEGTDASICQTGGTQVTQAGVIQVADGTTGTTKPLILDVKLDTPDPTNVKHVWKPTTFYRIELGPNAKLTPKQGGSDGLFPAGYKLCFQTTK